MIKHDFPRLSQYRINMFYHDENLTINFNFWNSLIFIYIYIYKVLAKNKMCLVVFKTFYSVFWKQLKHLWKIKIIFFIYYVYINIYIYMCVCVYIYMYKYIYVYIYILYIYIYIYIYIYHKLTCKCQYVIYWMGKLEILNTL